MIERQVIATWFTTEEKTPKDGEPVLVTFSGHNKNETVSFDHCLGIAWYWFDDGWELEAPILEDITEVTIHAWCDIDPYQG